MQPTRDKLPLALLLPLLGALLPACGGGTDAPPAPATRQEAVRDVLSFARPDQISITHLSLDLSVDFEAKTLAGRASLTLKNPGGAAELHLDTRDLDIAAVTLDDGATADFQLGEPQPLFGRELTIPVAPETRVVHVDYASRPEAAAVQWLEPRQTAGGRHPFLFTQSQPILARTWVPCQDTPGVRFTYDATIRVPPGLMALMSAENPTEVSADGVYTFRMPQPVPSYLLALAVGELELRSLGENSGVYAEPEVIEKAAWEFAETEAMMAAAARLYGPYRWGRFDVLVLPPSFPFGGMENPRLTFATPTILAGDRSLVALIAHELAHSWSGNLVTNATWEHFWLNEGFTTYIERRIMEELHGPAYSDMLALLGRQDLEGDFRTHGEDSPDTRLVIELAGRDPDAGAVYVAYEKGYLLLRLIEQTVGRERWDAFLHAWFDRYAFQSLTTARFVETLRAELSGGTTDLEEQLRLDAWLHGTGLPENTPVVESDAFALVEAQIAAWDSGTPAAELAVEGWESNRWQHFVRSLPATMDAERMAELDTAFGFTTAGNSEILHAWLMHAAAHRYEPAYPALRAFLVEIGRRKFLVPLYAKLAETEDGLAMARDIYAEARPGYHSMASSAIDGILGWEG